MDPSLASRPHIQNIIASMIPQKFALPYNFMGYIQKNYNSRVYAKLIQTCKYFFYSNNFVVVVDLLAVREFGNWNKILSLKALYQKLWITESIWICSPMPSPIPIGFPLHIFTQQIYRCDNISLTINNHYIHFDDLEILSKSMSFTKFDLGGPPITLKRGVYASCEMILALFPKVEEFSIFLSDTLTCTAESAKALADNHRLPNLTAFLLGYLPDYFNINDFMTFVKNHGAVEYKITFCPLHSTETYVTDFKNAAKAVCDDWKGTSEPPVFEYFSY